MSKTEFTLVELAQKLNSKIKGNGKTPIRKLSTLQNATADSLSFLASPSYHKYLEKTEAGAVILSPDMANGYEGNALIHDQPYLVFAKATHLFNNTHPTKAGIDSSASIAEDAKIHATACIGPNVVIENGVLVGEYANIGSGTFIGSDTKIGERTVIKSNVTIYHGTMIGSRCTIHAGAVIGSDGFGFAHDGTKWLKIAQIGNTVIGNDVEIGANTTIDRGALDDTVIGNNVILDNQIQIAHNVRIGDGTAIAANVGVAGSTTIGDNCLIGGGAGVSGHLDIANGVKIAGMGMVTKSITHENSEWSPGSIRSMPSKEWRKNACRFGQLDQVFRHVKTMETQLLKLTKNKTQKSKH